VDKLPDHGIIGCGKEQGEVTLTLQKVGYTEGRPVEEVVYHVVAGLHIKIVLEHVLAVFWRYQLGVGQMPFPVERLVQQGYAKGDDGPCLGKEIAWVMPSWGAIKSFHIGNAD